jgi:hypothetical protein
MKLFSSLSHPARDGLKDTHASQAHVAFYCEYVPEIVLQNRAAHIKQSTGIRQIARKPQPPIELHIVQFS